MDLTALKARWEECKKYCCHCCERITDDQPNKTKSQIDIYNNVFIRSYSDRLNCFKDVNKNGGYQYADKITWLIDKQRIYAVALPDGFYKGLFDTYKNYPHIDVTDEFKAFFQKFWYTSTDKLEMVILLDIGIDLGFITFYDIPMDKLMIISKSLRYMDNGKIAAIFKVCTGKLVRADDERNEMILIWLSKYLIPDLAKIVIGYF